MAITTANETQIAPQVGVRDRLIARLRSRRLDEALARGIPPETAAPLALRARLLTTLPHRRAIADDLRRVIRDTCRGYLPRMPGSRLSSLRSSPQPTTSADSPTPSQPPVQSRPAAWRRHGSCSPTAPAPCTTPKARRTSGHALPAQPTPLASRTDCASRPHHSAARHHPLAHGLVPWSHASYDSFRAGVGGQLAKALATTESAAFPPKRPVRAIALIFEWPL